MNRLILIGNLTKEPEVRTTQNGKTVCSFTVAANRRRKVEGQPEADFFRVSAWGKLGENCGKYLAKGKKVSVVGSVSVDTYTGNDGTTRASMEVFAEDVEFLSAGQGNGSAQTAMNDIPGAVAVETEELPF